ncbi:hypothetical protein [Aegicerativicinus sediminis]
MKKIATVLLIFSFCSCNYFENKKVDPQDIVNEEMKSINWSEVDEYPSFEFCDSLEGKIAKRDCFQNYLSKQVGKFLGNQNLIVSSEISDKAHMVITINSKGNLSVDSVYIGNNLHQQLPELDSLLSVSLDSLPPIYPAIKRGQQVKTQFNLPVHIVVD